MSTRKEKTSETKQQTDAPALIAYQVTPGNRGGSLFCGHHPA